MSDDLERRLRSAGRELPGPDRATTDLARERFLAATRTRERRSFSWRRAGTLAVALAVGMGSGYAVASAAQTTKVETRTIPTPAAGPGFLPAAGWNVLSTGAVAPPQAPTAIAANVPIVSSDPAATARNLGPGGVLIYAVFHPAQKGLRPTIPLPLASGLRGVEQRMAPQHRGKYDVEILVVYGPGRPAVAAAHEELARLVVEPCPAALPITQRDLPAAKRFVLRWLPSHYDRPSDLAGARATATLGAKMPRGGAATYACGKLVGSRTIEVDVVLPKVARYSASLSQLSYFVSKTARGWEVWERIH